MKPFAYDARRPTCARPSSADRSRLRGVSFLAGGTNLVDLMKDGVEEPGHLVDVSRLPLAEIEERADGGVRIGALARNTEWPAIR